MNEALLNPALPIALLAIVGILTAVLRARGARGGIADPPPTLRQIHRHDAAQEVSDEIDQLFRGKLDWPLDRGLSATVERYLRDPQRFGVGPTASATAIARPR